MIGPRAFAKKHSLWITNILLILLYGLFAQAHMRSMFDEFRLSVLLLLLFETIIISLLVFRRKEKEILVNWKTLLATAFGSFLPLMFRPEIGAEDILIAQVFQFIGLGMQLVSALSLNRSFGLLPANRGIQTSGMYRLVRHPLYLSYFVGQIGYTINNPSLLNLLIVLGCTLFQIVRIGYEEKILSRSEDYVRYSILVKYRLIPFVW